MGCLSSVAVARRLRPADRAYNRRAASLSERDAGPFWCRFVQYALRLVGVVVVLSLTPVTAVSSQDVQQDKFSDWNRIETIGAGVRTKVRLLESRSSEYVIVKGRFSSFSESSIILVLNDGSTQSIQRESVRVVRVRRSFFKRRLGWIVGAGAAALSCALATCDADITPLFIPIFTASYAAPAGLVACILSPNRLVYRSNGSVGQPPLE